MPYYDKSNQPLNYYRLQYDDGNFKIVNGYTSLDVIKQYDLASAKHVNTRIIKLQGEQLAIAIDNNQDD